MGEATDAQTHPPKADTSGARNGGPTRYHEVLVKLQ